jgi:hypothetical protein
MNKNDGFIFIYMHYFNPEHFCHNSEPFKARVPLYKRLPSALNLNEMQFSLAGHHYGCLPHSRARFIYLSPGSDTFMVKLRHCAEGPGANVDAT